MNWHKRAVSKTGMAIASILLLLIFMAWVSVSAVDARERVSVFTGLSTTTVQATLTPDATVTALSKELCWLHESSAVKREG
jgi:hypothetical protein